MKTKSNSDLIQSLLENYSFSDLSRDDKGKVLIEMTEAEYNDSRRTVLASVALFAEVNKHEPKPLIIEKEKSILLIPVPLYQMLIGIAAVALLMLLIFPIKQIGVTEQSVKYVAVNDTIIKEVIKYDTVEKVIEKPVYREKKIYVELASKSILTEEAPRLLEVPTSSQEISFSESEFRAKGSSLKDETVLFSLPKIH